MAAKRLTLEVTAVARLTREPISPDARLTREPLPPDARLLPISWTLPELALLETALSDDEIAQRTGRTANAVKRKRAAIRRESR